MLVVGTRSAELPRVADGEMAPGDEYCHTKLLTFKGKVNLQGLCAFNVTLNK